MDDIAKRLLETIQKRQMTYGDLATKTGIAKSAIQRYATGETKKIPLPRLEALADALGVSAAYLMGWDEPSPASRPLPAGLLPIEKRRIPILGPIAAGTPLTAEREYDNYVSIAGDSHHADAALRVEGDSMTPRYLDGDLVLIRLQDDVDNGQIAAVCIDDCITLKRLYHMPHGVQLVSENPKYAPMMFDASNSDSIRVMGLAVGYVRWEA